MKASANYKPRQKHTQFIRNVSPYTSDTFFNLMYNFKDRIFKTFCTQLRIQIQVI